MMIWLEGFGGTRMSSLLSVTQWYFSNSGARCTQREAWSNDKFGPGRIIYNGSDLVVRLRH